MQTILEARKTFKLRYDMTKLSNHVQRSDFDIQKMLKINVLAVMQQCHRVVAEDRDCYEVLMSSW